MQQIELDAVETFETHLGFVEYLAAFINNDAVKAIKEARKLDEEKNDAESTQELSKTVEEMFGRPLDLSAPPALVDGSFETTNKHNMSLKELSDIRIIRGKKQNK